MKRWLNPEREARIIELYERYENAHEVAAELGICDETVYRALRKHGIKRTHRHDKESDDTNRPHCKSNKYCPALIVMLNRCMGYKAKAIADVTGYEKNGVQNVLSKRGLTAQVKRAKKSDFDLDQIEYEYVNLGISSYELEKKYGISRSTISTWMRQRGVCLGKGNHQNPDNHFQPDASLHNMDGLNRSNARRHKECEKAFAKELREKTNGKFEYVSGYYRGKAVIRCNTCGSEYQRSTDMRKGIECPTCAIEMREKRKQGRNLIRILDSMREYALDKTCKECSKTFHSTSTTAMYCSDACRRKASNRRKTISGGTNGFRHYYRRKYGNSYREYFDPSISLKKLYERDGGICQICGEPCDWNDREWGTNGPTYPSIDHINPRANGGAHQWENVQLAHCMCNSCKRDLDNDAAKSEVMQRAS